jgi:DNA-binding transcriptional LysR family regulator
MDTRHLELLRELAERGSITAVAAATYRTPSAVSQQLRTAQREFGARLAEPAGRGLRLTDAGRLLAEGGTEVATAIEAVRARWAEFRRGPGGTVTIAAVPSAAELLLPDLLQALADTSITAHCRDIDIAEDAYPALASDHDLVVFTPARPPQPRGLLTRQLAREPLDVALPAGHRLAEHAALSPAQVAGEDWIAVPEGYPFNAVLAGIEAANGIPLRIVQRILDNRVAEALVAAGHGIAVLPRFTTHTGDRIVLRPLEGIPTARYITAVARADRAQRGAVAHTLDELATIARTASTP